MPTKSRTVALSLQEPVFLSLLREHLGIVPWSASDKMQTKTGFVYFILVRKSFAFDLAGRTAVRWWAVSRFSGAHQTTDFSRGVSAALILSDFGRYLNLLDSLTAEGRALSRLPRQKPCYLQRL
jgi:hypothetical protein